MLASVVCKTIMFCFEYHFSNAGLPLFSPACILPPYAQDAFSADFSMMWEWGGKAQSFNVVTSSTHTNTPGIWLGEDMTLHALFALPRPRLNLGLAIDFCSVSK